MPISKQNVVKRTGYALVGSSLIILILIGSVPMVGHPVLRMASFLLAVAGFALVILNWGLRYLYFMRLKGRMVYCLSCGWTGRGEDVFRLECCPECERAHTIQWLGH